jgi:thiamine-monophosphate kinase
MGAEPRALLLALTLPAADDTFLQQFSRGIQQATEAYGVELIGGDTTRGPLVITCTVMGVVPEKRALLRSGAQPGDRVFVSGTTGDAAAALTVIGGVWPGDAKYKAYLLQRFYRPSARVELGRRLLDIASSAIDVSDGVLADAGHLCEQSGVGIRIHADHLPLSPALRSVPDQELARRWALTGGEDYELLFTVPEKLAAQVPEGCVWIGEVVEGDEVHCDFEVEQTGYRHFSKNGGTKQAIPATRHADP